MTAPSLSNGFGFSASHQRDRSTPLETSFVFDIADVKSRLRWFASLMWSAFPGTSMRQKAQRASEAMGLTPRQCENLMRQKHDPTLGPVLAVLAIAGTERLCEIIEGRS